MMTDDEIRKLIADLKDSAANHTHDGEYGAGYSSGLESAAWRLEDCLTPCPPEKLRVLVEVDIDPEKWAAEYLFGNDFLGEGGGALSDAKGYVPTLLKDGLSRQEEWGVLRVVRATLV